uniref:Uncharacterized protein n=1 Tax=Plectus sambesii TaxID=2011161 RepID=A0A914V7U0_9BILA
MMSKMTIFLLCTMLAIASANFSEPSMDAGSISDATQVAPEPIIDINGSTSEPRNSTDDESKIPSVEKTTEEVPMPVVPPLKLEDNEKQLQNDVQSDTNTNEVEEKPARETASSASPVKPIPTELTSTPDILIGSKSSVSST